MDSQTRPVGVSADGNYIALLIPVCQALALLLLVAVCQALALLLLLVMMSGMRVPVRSQIAFLLPARLVLTPTAAPPPKQISIILPPLPRPDLTM